MNTTLAGAGLEHFRSTWVNENKQVKAEAPNPLAAHCIPEYTG